MVKQAHGFNDITPVYTRERWLADFPIIKMLCLLPKLPYKGDKRLDDPFQLG